MSTTRRTTLAEAAEDLGAMLTRSARLGGDLLSSVMPDTGQLFRRTTAGWGCDIPDPCWYPNRLGAVRSHVCPGATAVVRVRVTNCSPEPQRVGVDTKTAAAVTVSPAEALIEPFERVTFVVSAPVPAEEAPGTEREHTLWVRGCREHVLHWTVSTTKRGGDSCHEVDVDDCVDQVHHWYDHFYCPRPCGHGPREG